MVKTIEVSHFYNTINYNIEIDEELFSQYKNKFSITYRFEQEKGFSLKKCEEPFVSINALLSSYSIEKTSTGKNYLKLTFSTSEGNIAAKMWDNGNLETVIRVIEESNNNIFSLDAKVEEYPKGSGNKSLTISSLQQCSSALSPTQFLPTTSESAEDLTLELLFYISNLDEPYKSIANAMISKWWSEFSVKAAAKNMHHAYIGGLLEHTVGLLRFCYYMQNEKSIEEALITFTKVSVQESCRELFFSLKNKEVKKDFDYNWDKALDHIQALVKKYIQLSQTSHIDFSVIILAVLFHDFGKILEYTHLGENYLNKWTSFFPTADFDSVRQKPTGITIDTIGGGIGHIPISMMMFQNILLEEKISLPIEKIGEIMHSIAAHHGKIEWGSTSQLNSVNSLLVHLVDYLDSRSSGK